MPITNPQLEFEPSVDGIRRDKEGHVKSMVGKLAHVPLGFTPKAGATIYYDGKRFVLQAVVPHGDTFKVAAVPR